MKSRVDRRDIRVLIVDDELSILNFVDRVLSDAGYSTVAVSRGADAIRVFSAQGPFDLLLTDLMMPEMRGDELAAQLRRRDPRLRILYLTGFSDNLFKEKVNLWENEAYLDKPSSVNGILEAVSMLMFDHLLPDAPAPSLLGRVRALLSQDAYQ